MKITQKEIRCMSNYAKGFECGENGERIYTPIGSSYRTRDFYYSDLSSFFLQRVIEGINSIDIGFRIEQMYNQIEVTDSEEYTVLCIFDFSSGCDTAKIAAIRYVMEQKQS